MTMANRSRARARIWILAAIVGACAGPEPGSIQRPVIGGTNATITSTTTVNRYTALSAGADMGDTFIDVASAAALNAAAGDLLFIIQMQGATIDASNSLTAYGAVTNLNGAGSFVNKDCEPWGIYVGSPARRIGERRRL